MRSLFVFTANEMEKSLVGHPMTSEGRINIILAHAHHHDDQQAQQQQAKPYADEPALTEQCFAAGGEGQHRRGRGASVAWRSARVLPLLIVSDELR